MRFRIPRRVSKSWAAPLPAPSPPWRRPERGLYAVQFHPEVAHTPCGTQILKNFVFGACGCVKDWDPAGQVQAVEDQIRAVAQDRNIFFFVSGGVDSTVAYTLCLRALGPERVHGTYVDTGLMREGETEFVRANFSALGARAFAVEDAATQFLSSLATAVNPEDKRHIIGEEFVRVQQRILESEHFLDGRWILGQGTIYPDTIESGGTAKADLIKTHHNRVAGIQKLIDEGRIIEPLASFYKDEVRAIGRQLGLAAGAARPASVPGTRARDTVFVHDIGGAGRRRCPKAGCCRCKRSACRAIREPTGPSLAIDGFPDSRRGIEQPDQSRWSGLIGWWWKSGPPGN